MPRCLGICCRGNRRSTPRQEDVDLSGVREIAAGAGLTFYKASYVWLAWSRWLNLRTRDKEILRESPDVAVRRLLVA